VTDSDLATRAVSCCGCTPTGWCSTASTWTRSSLGPRGVTAPFLKELLRRAALLAAEADATGEGPLRVTDSDLATALDELLAGRSQLTRMLLGGEAHE
jgi:hypothetical protein